MLFVSFLFNWIFLNFVHFKCPPYFSNANRNHYICNSPNLITVKLIMLYKHFVVSLTVHFKYSKNLQSIFRIKLLFIYFLLSIKVMFSKLVYFNDIFIVICFSESERKLTVKANFETKQYICFLIIPFFTIQTLEIYFKNI